MEEEIEEERNNAVVVDIDDPPWVKYMEAKLAFKSKHCQRSHPFTICQVPRDIREVDGVAHDPLVVSIGPYHRGNKNLLDMEQVKWRNLNEFRGRVGKYFNEYLKAMKEIEQRARDCYSGNIDMDADEFIEMMLLDGLFMTELFAVGNIFEEPIYTISGMLCRVGRDMLLLENQLPFFVLEHLWSLNTSTDQRSRFELWKRAYAFIRSFLRPFNLEWDHKLLRVLFDKEEEKTKKKRENPADVINEDGVHHLLHLVYLLLKPAKPTDLSFLFRPIRENVSFISQFIKNILSDISFISPFIEKILSYYSFLCPSMSKVGQGVIPSAVELDEAGVVFKCVKAKRFFDVKFEGGTMEMLRLSVEDSTKPLLRNFIAYEQCFPKQGDHITSYCRFMDHLVNTRRDVEILKKSNIIENWLGSDMEVALLFNDLGKGIFVLSDSKDSYLGKLLEQVTKHTQKPWHKWQAKLNHDYLSNPWAIISVLAATFVIILTAVQTYYAVVA